MAAPSGSKPHRSPPSLKEIVRKLSGRCPESRERGLQEVQALVRKSKGLETVRSFRELGGLDRVVGLVKSGEERLVDLALSVLATCCREMESKARVSELEGISTIVEVLKSQSSLSIINRASRALANLADSPRLSGRISRPAVLPALVGHLREISDSHCRQSLLRTLRILADTGGRHAGDVLSSGALGVVLGCLDSEDVKLVGCAAHTAAEITSNLGSAGHGGDSLRSYREAGKQAVEENGVGLLVGLLSHPKPSVQEHVLVALLNLMTYEGVRVDAGRAGAVEVFIERGRATGFPGWPTYVHCLCFCCREAVNRVRLRDLEGLQVLLGVLKSSSSEAARLHETVLVALMDFYYDELSLNYLATCGFILILISQLRQEICAMDLKSHITKPKGLESREPKGIESTESKSVGSTESKSMESTESKDVETTESKDVESTECAFVTKTVSTSRRIETDNSQKRQFVGTQRKRERNETESVRKKFKREQSGDYQSSSIGCLDTESTELPNLALGKSEAIQKPSGQSPADHQAITSSPIPSSKEQIVCETGSSSPWRVSAAASGMPSSSALSPSHPTNYHSYLNPEATPYSPPRVDWEGFLQHREQTGQELSPRSYSSFSSPMSLSPQRYDFSPMSSPNWSPQWSPQHSPQHVPKWLSPEHSTEWSSHPAPQWSPQHSPEWDPESNPVALVDRPTSPPPDARSETAKVSVEVNQSEASPSTLLASTNESLQTNLDEPDTAGIVDPFSASLSFAEETPSTSKSLTVSPDKEVGSQLSSSAEEASVQDVGFVSLSDKAEASGEVTSEGRRDQRSLLGNRIQHKGGIFREPNTKSLKMRTGKNKTTSVVSRQAVKPPSLDILESDSDLFPQKEPGEASDTSVPSKFEREMEIRRAKVEGKLRRREYAVVTLLSRYSHMDDPSGQMAKESVVSALLDYRPSSPYLQSKAQRTLHRILRNRLCFEQLILEHVPMLIARKTLERQRKPPPTATSDDAVASTRARTPSGSSDHRLSEDDPQRGFRRGRALRRSQSVCDLASSASDQTMRSKPTDSDAVSDTMDDTISDTASVSSVDTLESEQFQLWGDTASPLYPLMVSTCQYRQGLMQGLLLSDSCQGKMACVLAVPYICQSNSLRRKLLIKHKGLQVLLDYLRLGSIRPTVFRKAVQCLCDLSSLILTNPSPSTSEGNRLSLRDFQEHAYCLDKGIVIDEAAHLSGIEGSTVEGFEESETNPEMEASGLLVPGENNQEEGRIDLRKGGEASGSVPPRGCTSCCYDAIETPKDVSFRLDEDLTIPAHRERLVRSSEFFACLLEGPYVESEQSVVPLKEISEEGLLLVLHTLYGCARERCCHMRDALAGDCQAALDSIACSGRFLLSSVQDQLCEALVDSHLDAASVVGHFRFGLEHSCSRLTSACLTFLLTSGEGTADHFQEVVETGLADAAFKAVERMLTDALFSVS